jgi:hypothetical protein
MDTSLLKDHEPSDKLPAEVSWIAMAIICATTVVFVLALWFLMIFRAGALATGWTVGLTSCLFVSVLVALAWYLGHRYGTKGRTYSRKMNVFLGICYGCIGSANLFFSLEQGRHRPALLELASAVVFFFFGAVYLYRAFKPKDPAMSLK